jgi:serpin B
MKMVKTIVMGIIALVAVTACGDKNIGNTNGKEEPQPAPADTAKVDSVPYVQLKPRTDIPLTETEKQLAKAGNAFAFRLLQAVAGSEEEQTNLLLSPFSAGLALAMADNGAAGTTREEIQKTLGFGGVAAETMNAYFQKMTVAMKDLDNTSAFHSANSIWVDEGFGLLPGFVDANRTYYEAEVKSLPFAAPGTKDSINAWCAAQTKGLIPIMLNENPPGPVCLLNALYFRAAWTSPFDKASTEVEHFRNETGGEKAVEMMNQSTKSVRYYEDEACRALEMFYGNCAFSMLLLLPEEGVALSSLRNGLDSTSWNKLLNGLEPGYLVNIKLPRFTTDDAKELKDVLISLGMPAPFSAEKADFSGFSSERIYLSQIFQKAHIGVDETGTEAAAVTGDFCDSFNPDDKPVRKDFYATHPFLFFIREQSSGAILFMGEIKCL